MSTDCLEYQINPETIRRAAEETADPVVVFEAALAKAGEDPSALYASHVIDALKTLRKKDELAYTRQILKANGHQTRLDKLTKPDSSALDESMADRIVQIARNRCKLAHDANGNGVAIIDDGEVRQVWYVDGNGFHDWLRAAYFEATQSGINGNALDTAIATIAAIGKHAGEEVEVHVRCAHEGTAYYLDLCDDDWRAIRIDANGWDVVRRPPVLFTRTKNMRPIPVPYKGGDVAKVWRHVNVPPSRQLPVLTWILDAYRPDTPFPVLEVTGEQGAAKSTSERRLRDLIDPNRVALRGRPKTVEDIFVAASNNWIVSFENVSHLSPEQQDALCTVATGGGFATRQFYTNGDEYVLETKRPIMLNGINPVATQPDLIERAVSIEAPAISANNRLDEKALEAEWQADYPEILGGLLDLFSRALRLLPEIKLPEKFRLADYQMLGEATARALGHNKGHFTKVFREVATEGVERALETYGVANALQVLMFGKQKPWKGTMQMLLVVLNALPEVDHSSWPKTARGLGGQLKRLAPGLRLKGIKVERPPKDRDGAQVVITNMNAKK